MISKFYISILLFCSFVILRSEENNLTKINDLISSIKSKCSSRDNCIKSFGKPNEIEIHTTINKYDSSCIDTTFYYIYNGLSVIILKTSKYPNDIFIKAILDSNIIKLNYKINIGCNIDFIINKLGTIYSKIDNGIMYMDDDELASYIAFITRNNIVTKIIVMQEE